ncbi:MAG: sulfide/dihydroorotate dehydrogenase-like FAD/NAD-binding protein [Nitrospirae bacterium]|nr:MAG: sulfide/dihydroorotate dehydrogenase-like FAD/NAD-binding protein [Nitrospirota bacterium]
MAKILEKRVIRKPDVFYFRIEAPRLSRVARPGQFVMVRVNSCGERIPLSLADISPDAGSISLIVMAVGKTTSEMSLLEEGQELLDLCGPLGRPTEIAYYGHVVLVGGGFGVAPLYPIGRELKRAGNRITTIIGARSADLIIYREEMTTVSDRVVITTNDGSEGIAGFVTDGLKEVLVADRPDRVMAVGPSVMMKAVSELTRPFKVKTIVSLNPIMVDGTGMCGGCRVVVGGKVLFACVDGPDFDGHLVDWQRLIRRQQTYKEEERLSFEQWKRLHADRILTE